MYTNDKPSHTFSSFNTEEELIYALRHQFLKMNTHCYKKEHLQDNATENTQGANRHSEVHTIRREPLKVRATIIKSNCTYIPKAQPVEAQRISFETFLIQKHDLRAPPIGCMRTQPSFNMSFLTRTHKCMHLSCYIYTCVHTDVCSLKNKGCTQRCHRRTISVPWRTFQWSVLKTIIEKNIEANELYTLMQWKAFMDVNGSS